jgi:stress-induced morphogen
MVYNALSEELKEELHALTIKTIEKKWKKIFKQLMKQENI